MKSEQNKSKILKSKYIPTADFYAQVIDSLQDYSIFTLDNDLIINSWNSGATNIFGYETDEIIGEHFNIVFTEEDIKNGIPESEIKNSMLKGKATDNRWHICKDGSTFYAFGLVFPLLSLEGEKLGYVKILRNQTEKKKAEDAIKKYVKDLEDLNAHKESVMAIVSHDLRSPLASIISTLDYLNTNIDKMDKSLVKEMLGLACQSSKDELNMLDYLVEWARIKYASEAFSPKKVPLLEYVNKVFGMLGENANLNTISLHHEIEEDVMIFADSKMLLSILQNIISNAIKHTQIGGTVSVTATKKEDKMIVRVRDTGVGMSKEIQEKLFTPQAKSLLAEREDNKGAGIGLLLVKGFLEKNGGEIWVESEIGQGSSFYFTLPLE